ARAVRRVDPIKPGLTRDEPAQLPLPISTSHPLLLPTPLSRPSASERGPAAGAMNGNGGSDDDKDMGKPLLASTGSWWYATRKPHVPAFLCTLVVALGPIQFGFTGGFSSPTQDAVTRDLSLSVSEV
uniref:Uncharacterized protein n=1 Tax=Aegilops tauschii subsp. strangulata TaxID=200361 RepID=A0A453J4C3_AEGTS